MIEINEALGQIYKVLEEFCGRNEMQFRYDKNTMVSSALPVEQKDNKYYMYMEGAAGTAIVEYDGDDNKIKLLGSSEQNAKAEDCTQLSLWLLEPSVHDERDVKSIANDFAESMEGGFQKPGKERCGKLRCANPLQPFRNAVPRI